MSAVVVVVVVVVRLLPTVPPGVRQFSKNMGGPAKFCVPEALREALYTLEGPHFWSDLSTSLLPSALCWVHMNRYAFVFARKTAALIALKILDAIIEHLVGRHLYLPSCCCYYYYYYYY
jgi:hypothetical protein